MQIVKILLQNTLIFFCFANPKLVHDWVRNIKMPLKLWDKKRLLIIIISRLNYLLAISIGFDFH